MFASTGCADLAMTCVIINHSKLSSLLSWFSYERFWVVTAAEVFVVLSGVVIGTVYGRRLARDGWQAVVRGLGRRALFLYSMFVGVTVLDSSRWRRRASMSAPSPAITRRRGSSRRRRWTWTAWRDVLHPHRAVGV